MLKMGGRRMIARHKTLQGCRISKTYPYTRSMAVLDLNLGLDQTLMRMPTLI